MLPLGLSWSCQQAAMGGEIARLSMKGTRRIKVPTGVCCGSPLSALGRKQTCVLYVSTLRATAIGQMQSFEHSPTVGALDPMHGSSDLLCASVDTVSGRSLRDGAQAVAQAGVVGDQVEQGRLDVGVAQAKQADRFGIVAQDGDSAC